MYRKMEQKEVLNTYYVLAKKRKRLKAQWLGDEQKKVRST